MFLHIAITEFGVSLSHVHCNEVFGSWCSHLLDFDVLCRHEVIHYSDILLEMPEVYSMDSPNTCFK